MDEKQTLRIRDLGLAAALISLGHNMCNTDRDTNGRSYFIFTQTKTLERDVNNFWADSLEVKARKYFDDIKMLKSRIYGER